MTAPAPDPQRIETTTRLEPGDVRAVLEVVSAAAEADRRRPLSEQTELTLRRGGEEPGRQVVARAPGGRVLGYAHVDPAGAVAVAELVVDPRHRRRGIGRRLLEAAEQAAGDRALRVWAHGDPPAARALGASRGYRRVRELWLMRRELSRDLPAFGMPPGVVLRAFRPGQDDEAWLAVNARAFADHPEQGAMTLRDLRERMAEPWFDPEGFLVAEEPATGRMLGFHWTKVHPDGDPVGEGPVGEVYVVGVDPDAQGRGLGPALTLAGLHHLRRRGLEAVILYVESDNEAAVRVYSRLGFARVDADVMYERAPAGA